MTVATALVSGNEPLPWLAEPLRQALATARLSAQHSLETLSGVPVLELSGGSDFSAGAQACLEFLQ